LTTFRIKNLHYIIFLNIIVSKVVG
jgi:hypothetical protein